MRDGKKKILYLITKSNWGGAQRYVYDLACALPKEQFDVAVVLGGDGALAQRLKEEQMRVITLPLLGRDVHFLNDIKIFFGLVRLLKKESPDIIHLNSAKIGGLGALAGKMAGVKKIIFTAHGWAFNEERGFVSRAIFWLLYAFIIFLCDVVCAVSNNIKTTTPLFFLFKKKIRTTYNGIQKETLLLRQTAEELLFGRTPIGLVIGSIGELHKSKGFKYLIGAVEKLKITFPSIRLVILGEGKERGNLERIIKEKNLADTVTLKGFVDHGARYLKALDVFVLSSTTEAFGYVLLEAGLAEIPIVATKVGGVPEIISQKNLGILVPASSEEALTEGIKKMLEEKEYARLCAINLKKRVVEEFSVDKMRAKTYALYN